MESVNTISLLPWEGYITVVTRHDSGYIEVDQFKNLVVDDGKNMLRDALLGLVTDLKIKYIALGNGTTAPAANQHTLVNELFRKPITASSAGATAGQDNLVAYIAPYEAVFDIQEIGWFAGPNATASPNSGIMVARVLWVKTKTDKMSLQITRVDAIG